MQIGGNVFKMSTSFFISMLNEQNMKFRSNKFHILIPISVQLIGYVNCCRKTSDYLDDILELRRDISRHLNREWSERENYQLYWSNIALLKNKAFAEKSSF